MDHECSNKTRGVSIVVWPKEQTTSFLSLVYSSYTMIFNLDWKGFIWAVAGVESRWTIEYDALNLAWNAFKISSD